MRHCVRLILFSFASLEVACAVDVGQDSADPAAGQEVTARQDAFSAQWNFSWGVTQPSSIVLGPNNDRTCFLTGMVGDLGSNGSGSVDISGANWVLNVKPEGSPLGAYARCVNTVANRTADVPWQTGQPAVNIAVAAAHRQCFLTGLAGNTHGVSNRGFRDEFDDVQVQKQGSTWLLGGHQSGGAIAKAACVDITTNVGSWLWVAGDNTRKDPMASNPGDVTCFLTGIGGNFSKGDWADGAFITEEKGQFFMNTKNRKRGWATCAR